MAAEGRRGAVRSHDTISSAHIGPARAIRDEAAITAHERRRLIDVGEALNATPHDLSLRPVVDRVQVDVDEAEGSVAKGCSRTPRMQPS